MLRGDMPLVHWDATDGAFLLDVREPVELVVESVPGAVNISMGQLRSRLGELPRDREVLIICRSPQRAHCAARILVQNRFKARSISGGMLSRAMLAQSSGKSPGGKAPARLVESAHAALIQSPCCRRPRLERASCCACPHP
jgi:rhodanese-related sulfurtransferase